MTEPTAGVDGWRRLSPWAVCILFTQGVIRFMRENIPLLLGAGAGATLVERIGIREVALVTSALLLIAALLSLLYYRRFRFRLDDDMLVVRKGLMERTELKVSADRVQHIAIEQPFYMRPFGVVRFSLDTPGGITTEVELPGIRRDLAEKLRTTLAGARVAGEGATAADQLTTAVAPESLFRIGPAAITLHGLASNHAYVAAAALAPFIQPLERIAVRHLEGLAELPWLQQLMESPLLALAGSIGVLLVVLVMLSVVVSWLRFFGFHLLRDRGRFIQRSGLLTRREQTLSSAKLQSVEWVETAVGRALGRGYLICRQYGGAPAGADHAGHKFIVPGLDRDTGRWLCHVFWPDLAPADTGTPRDRAAGEVDPLTTDPGPPYRRVHVHYRRVTALRFGLLAMILAVILTLTSGHTAWLLAGLAAVALSWPFAHLRWLAVGWKRRGRYLLVRRGLLGRRTTLFPLDHMQAVTLRQSWFQRRHGLATLRFQLASGAASLPFIDKGVALALANEAVYRVERLALPRQ